MFFSQVVICLYIAGILYSIPKFLEYETVTETVPGLTLNETTIVYMFDYSKIGKNQIFREIVHSWMYLICVCGVPFLTLVVLNAFLILAVRNSRKKGKLQTILKNVQLPNTVKPK